MPTGYTEKVPKGLSFEQFALRCARAFGALVELRDASLDAPLPKSIQPSTYHLDEKRKAEARIAHLQGMTPAEVEQTATAEYDAAVEAWTASENERQHTVTAYTDMLAKVDLWTPPSPEHEGMKKFMREQLQESLRFDCVKVEPPTKHSGKEWLTNAISSASRDLAYHAEHHALEVHNAARRNAWLQSLRASLKPTNGRKKRTQRR